MSAEASKHPEESQICREFQCMNTLSEAFQHGGYHTLVPSQSTRNH